MASNPSSRANAAEHAERQVRAYELKILGYSLRDIARIMTDEGTQVSHETVRILIKDEGDSRVLPLADEVRKMEIDRLDRWLVKLNGQIEAERSVARNVEVGVKVSERRARLLAADAPIQQEIAAIVEHKPTEILDLINRARQQAEEDEAHLREGPP